MGGFILYDHVRVSQRLEVVVDDVVFALGKFQCLVGCLQDVMPKLAVFAGLFHKDSQCGLESLNIDVHMRG